MKVIVPAFAVLLVAASNLAAAAGGETVTVTLLGSLGSCGNEVGPPTFQVSAWSLSGATADKLGTSTANPVVTGLPTLGNLQLVKQVDQCSISLIRLFLTGLPVTTLTVTQPAANGMTTFNSLTLTLTNAAVSSYSRSGSNLMPVEQISVIYEKACISTFTLTNSGNAPARTDFLL